MPVVVVTDSTASLPPEVADKRGLVVVPLQVVIGADAYDEGSEGATPELVAAALKEFRPVSTSRPTPAALLEVYEDCVRQGATEIVSVHLSSDMSGTFESAQLAARDASVPVVPVDSRQVGVATGYAALSAADVVDAGGVGEGGCRRCAGPGRAVPVAVLRGHPRVPAARRADRCRRRAGRRGPGWSSRSWRSRTGGSRPWSECGPRPARWPGSRSWRCRKRLRPGRGHRRPPGQPRPRRSAAGEAGIAAGGQPRRPRGVVRPARRRTRRSTSGPACSPSASHRCSSSRSPRHNLPSGSGVRGGEGGVSHGHRDHRPGAHHRRTRTGPVDRGCPPWSPWRRRWWPPPYSR